IAAHLGVREPLTMDKSPRTAQSPAAYLRPLAFVTAGGFSLSLYVGLVVVVVARVTTGERAARSPPLGFVVMGLLAPLAFGLVPVGAVLSWAGLRSIRAASGNCQWARSAGLIGAGLVGMTGAALTILGYVRLTM